MSIKIFVYHSQRISCEEYLNYIFECPTDIETNKLYWDTYKSLEFFTEKTVFRIHWDRNNDYKMIIKKRPAYFEETKLAKKIASNPGYAEYYYFEISKEILGFILLNSENTL